MTPSIMNYFCCNNLMSHLAIRANESLKIVYLCLTCGNNETIHLDD